ncbi:MAG: CoA transferase [Syntrophobacteraceae bacterium]
MSAEDTKKALDKRMSLKEAVSRFVFDGCSIAFSGMGGQQVVAPTYEIVRQGQKDMTLMGDSPCECADYLVGTGQLKRVEVAWLAFVPGRSDGPSLHDYKIAYRLIDRNIQRHDQGDR